MEAVGNPWLEDSGESYELGGSANMPPDVVHNTMGKKDIGKSNQDELVKLNIDTQEETFTAVISQSNIKLFKDEMEMKKQ